MSAFHRALIASAGLLAAACGNSESQAQQAEPRGPGPSASDYLSIELTHWVSCFMRDESGDVWFVKHATPVDLSPAEMGANGVVRTDFLAAVQDQYGDELGANPSEPSCFVRSDEASASAQIDRFVQMAERDGDTIRDVD